MAKTVITAAEVKGLVNVFTAVDKAKGEAGKFYASLIAKLESREISREGLFGGESAFLKAIKGWPKVDGKPLGLFAARKAEGVDQALVRAVGAFQNWCALNLDPDESGFEIMSKERKAAVKAAKKKTKKPAVPVVKEREELEGVATPDKVDKLAELFLARLQAMPNKNARKEQAKKVFLALQAILMD